MHNTPIELVETRQGYHLFGVEPQQQLSVPGFPNLSVEILQAHHSEMNCVGYGFSTLKKKLLPQYHHLCGSKDGGLELKKLRESGIDVNETISIPEFVYFCDSSIHNLSDHKEWHKYPVIMCECTGFPEFQTCDQMTSREHSHLILVEEIMRQHPDKQWILMHASMGVPKTVLQEHEERLKKDGLNVIIWCSE